MKEGHVFQRIGMNWTHLVTQETVVKPVTNVQIGPVILHKKISKCLAFFSLSAAATIQDLHVILFFLQFWKRNTRETFSNLFFNLLYWFERDKFVLQNVNGRRRRTSNGRTVSNHTSSTRTQCPEKLKATKERRWNTKMYRQINIV